MSACDWASVARADKANVFNASVPRRPADVTLLCPSQLTADPVDGLATTLASAVSHTQVFIAPIGLEEGFPGVRVGKNILIFSDGTGQAGGYMPDETRSNVYKLFRATRVCPDTRIDPRSADCLLRRRPRITSRRGWDQAQVVAMALQFACQGNWPRHHAEHHRLLRSNHSRVATG